MLIIFDKYMVYGVCMTWENKVEALLIRLTIDVVLVGVVDVTDVGKAEFAQVHQCIPLHHQQFDPLIVHAEYMG